jgi:hypothetical protein
MPEDKHFNEPGAMPEALEDHRPTDLPATRVMFILLFCLLTACALIFGVIYYGERGTDATAPPSKLEGVQ